MPTPKSRIQLPHLRAWRLHALMTQEQLAQAAGIGESTIVHAEVHGRLVNALTAAKIAKALGVTLRQLETTTPEEA